MVDNLLLHHQHVTHFEISALKVFYKMQNVVSSEQFFLTASVSGSHCKFPKWSNCSSLQNNAHLDEFLKPQSQASVPIYFVHVTYRLFQ